MKPKKLIEVSLPIKEISAESVRDKSIRHGHISTLHLWWARRPLPTCRAVVFASLVPDPDDPNTPRAFKDAVHELLDGSQYLHKRYLPYKDIPYTVVYDPMEDNLRNRLMMFIGRFSEKCQKNIKEGKSTPPKEQLSDGSLIKWENKNNPEILKIARELIWVAYNSELNPEKVFSTHHEEFNQSYDAILKAEKVLYSIPNRNIETEEVKKAQETLDKAIESFQRRMPSVFDPFAGGGAIPLEAARLGCRSYGNDINPVAHIIEKGSAEFPQKYGKPITYTKDEFLKLYGEEGKKLLEEKNIEFGDKIKIPNRLAFDVEFCAKEILRKTEEEVGHLYPCDQNGNKPIAYYWARTAKCSNPSCGAEVPLLRQFYLANTKSKQVYLNPIINGKEIDFEIKEGKVPKELEEGWNKRCNLTCPCCGSITDAKRIKKAFNDKKTRERLIAVIWETEKGKEYRSPTLKEKKRIEEVPFERERPTEMLPQNDSQNLKIPLWGYKSWGDIFSNIQINTINTFIKIYKHFFENKIYEKEDGYFIALKSYLSLWFDRVAIANTSFGLLDIGRETLVRIMGKQALPMTFDYPESNPFCSSSGSASNHIDWIVKYIESESFCEFSCEFANASSGEKKQFKENSITAVITDPPYYDAISYSDLSDFFYIWLKRLIGDIYPICFSTPLTPKSEECTAIKHRFEGGIREAKAHFERKLTQIFSAIEEQTRDIVSIMFAHQTTEAWTTLCNSILDSGMNITGSWPLDTEMSTGLKTNKATLESSVTVSCRPSDRDGFEEFKKVKKDIEKKVDEEVKFLYNLGFRGADLLTACFGPAVSEFGKYESVEKANGDEVTVSELLDLTRETAFNALLKGIDADDYTKFYLGWLQLNGTNESDNDDATKFTRVGLNVEIDDILKRKLLIREGNKVHLAMADERIFSNTQGYRAEDPVIDQVHRAISLVSKPGNDYELIKLIGTVASEPTSTFWRVLDLLRELLPANEDLKAVNTLLQNQETFRSKGKEGFVPRDGELDLFKS